MKYLSIVCTYDLGCVGICLGVVSLFVPSTCRCGSIDNGEQPSSLDGVELERPTHWASVSVILELGFSYQRYTAGLRR
jgi:hypothetical protein